MSVAFDRSSPPRDSKRPSHTRLLNLPDQSGVRADLAVFFGPNAERYIEVYDRMRSSTMRIAPGVWNWPAFFFGFVWFFYRKMYAYGAIVLFTPMVFAYLVGTTSGTAGVWAVCSRMCTGWYVNRALDRVAKADQLGLTGEDRVDYLRRAGGVSLTAGIFAAVIYAALAAAVVGAVFARRHVGH